MTDAIIVARIEPRVEACYRTADTNLRLVPENQSADTGQTPGISFGRLREALRSVALAGQSAHGFGRLGIGRKEHFEGQLR
jgi:hypothetical protein